MKLIVYCSSNRSETNKPVAHGGIAVRNLRFQLLPGAPAKEEKAAEPMPSANLFREGTGGAALDVINVTDIVAAEFRAGETYEIEIRPVSE